MILLRPATVAEALDCVDQSDPAGSRFYAGGIETVFGLRMQTLDCTRLIDTKRVAGAIGVARADGRVRIGPATTHYAIAGDATVRAALPLLGAACSRLGTLPIRTRGTIGGNFAHGHQYTDPGTAAAIYGGAVTIASTTGARVVPLERFWLGPYEVDCRPGELIESIELTTLGPGWLGLHDRVEELHRPPGALVSLAVRLDNRRTIAECRLAVGGVPRRPVRLPELETSFLGATLEDVSEARSLEQQLAPLVHAETDLLGSADFKVAQLAGLIRRSAHRLARQSA
jgi:CO/xanthine dehydrogenase FAD-binding subunit